MKKLLEKIVKPIKSKENSYRLNEIVLQESGENAPDKEPSKLDVYKNFDFDSENAVSVGSKKEMENKKNTSPDSNLVASNSPRKSNVNNLSNADKKKIKGEFEKSEVEGLYSHSKNLWENDVDLNGKKNMKSLESDAKEAKKTNSNTYVINISNSKEFIVGSLKNINVGNPAKDDLKKLNSLIDWSTGGNTEYDLDCLLDSKEKLNEDIITLISVYINHRWKDFGKSLGFEELFLETLEQRNDGKTSLVVYDFLQRYLNEFPNTSLGFVAYVLNKIQSTDVIEKLAENKRC